MLGHPQVVEILSLAGFDYLVLDQEHGLGDATSLAAQLHAMSATPTVGVVRVPWNDHVYLKRVLDVGAEAVLIPSIDTADEARAAVAACLYPPRGRRGTASSSVRASSYGMAPDYVGTCAENLLIACQIESATAVDNIDAILAVEGIDLMFIGPFDLSATVGQMGNLKHPEVARADRARRDRASAPRAARWVPCRIPGCTWKDMFARGYQFVNAGSDISRLRDGALADVKEFRGALPQGVARPGRTRMRMIFANRSMVERRGDAMSCVSPTASDVRRRSHRRRSVARGRRRHVRGDRERPGTATASCCSAASHGRRRSTSRSRAAWDRCTSWSRLEFNLPGIPEVLVVIERRKRTTSRSA